MKYVQATEKQDMSYVNVQKRDMAEFLEGQGFTLLGGLTYKGKPIKELVWAKIVRSGDAVISMRVYTGIESNGDSRAKGKDAIRVYLFWRNSDKEIKQVGGSARVHRMENWRKHLQSRIDNWVQILGPGCPDCGAPTVERTVKNGERKGSKFFGCCQFPVCRGIAK